MTHPLLRLPRPPGDPRAFLREREWLVTNGLGGFASGTVLGVPTRRSHGLFVPNLIEPRGRYVVLPRLDDAVETDAGLLTLGGAEFLDGRCTVDAHRCLREFRLEGLRPVWLFDFGGSRLERSLVMPHGHNAVCVRWRLLEGPPLCLRLRPYAGGRRQDDALATPAQPGAVAPDDAAGCTVEEVDGSALLLRLPGSDLTAALQLRPAAAFLPEPHTDRDVLFRVERERGYDHAGPQHSPGAWRLRLAAGEQVSLVASSGEPLPQESADALFEREHERAAALLRRAQTAQAEGSPGPAGADEVESRLVLAADQFVVRPANRRGDRDDADGSAHCDGSGGGDDGGQRSGARGPAGTSSGSLRSVIAGYPWFNDWGRDTMISLEGLTLSTGRFEEARAILRTYAGYIRDGLLPNLFPEGGREALYHTVDATLWYFHALERYTARSGDAALVRELYPRLQDVIEHHLRGTRFGIGVDARDGLVHAAAPDLQLTWMDAKVDGWVVTPRRGKPVEIQALWHNALRLMAGWGRACGDGDAGRYDELAARVQASFERRFWSAERGHLLDVVDGPDGDDPSLRPNQVFALSLTHPVLSSAHWRAVLSAVEHHLLTPVGLRTLAPGEPGYRPRYQGSLRERDAAYHQGTVWPWLLGPFVDAWLRVHGPGPQARALLQALPGHLLDTGLGSISEVFDAEPPHREGGCTAQAWSVAELLRAWQATRPDR